MAQGKNGYIPPAVQRQMDQHLQRMPANLQKYQGGNTYIPQKAAQQMTDHLNKSVPKSMQKYVSSYMHQQTTAGLNSLDPVRNAPLQERPPTPSLVRRDHSAFGEQFSVDINTSEKPDSQNISFSPQYSAAQSGSLPPAQPAANPSDAGGQQNPYDFILKDAPKPKRNLLGGGSFKSRLLIIAGGGLLLLVLAIVFISVLSSGNKGVNQQLLELAQEQTEIMRVSEIGIEKARSADTKNLATTIKYSVTSSRNDVLSIINKKSTDKALTLKKNSSTDQTLDTAATNNNFDAVFTETMSNTLKTYQANVRTIYNATGNQKTKQTLSDTYNSAGVLIIKKTNQ
jgi:hypothetical protein